MSLSQGAIRFFARCFAIACWPVFLWGQNDSTLVLPPDLMEEKQIRVRSDEVKPGMFYSATRSENRVQDLPFSIWTISAEEILRNGFITLGDVLKAAPGIRVSQPGNALEGETFLMRGMSGNGYVKILINDVPVKPSILGGTPIGAQFPVRQAARIEVLYGPASALYGHEACAGVVNIILKESERPLFTQADLSFGNNGFNSLNLMFGGKLGRNKKAFRFSLYGSNTVRNWYNNEQTGDTTQALFNINTYVPADVDPAFYRTSFNYRPRALNDNFTVRTTFPHESRLLGVDLRWRGFQLTYHSMSRSDQSALGLNPLSQSAENPSNYVKERLDIFALQKRRYRAKSHSYHSISVLNYRMNPYSSASYIFDQTMKTAYLLRRAALSGQADFQTFREIESEYGFFTRYQWAFCLEGRLESKTTFYLNRKWRLTGGTILNAFTGGPYTGYLRQPTISNSLFTLDSWQGNPIGQRDAGGASADLYSQLEYRGKKLYLNVSGLAGIPYSSVNYGPSGHLNPRLAGIWHLDSAFSVWGNYTTGIKHVSPHAILNTFKVADGEGYLRQNSLEENLHDEERTEAWQAGMRYDANRIQADLSFFRQSGEKLLLNNTLIPVAGNAGTMYYYGYQNALNQTLNGVQAHFKSLDMDVELENINQQRGGLDLNGYVEYAIQYAWGTTTHYNVAPAVQTKELYNQPRWQRQFRIFFTLGKLETVISTNTQSSVLSQSVLYSATEGLPNLPARHAKFRTNDLSFRWYFSKYFIGYLHVQNLWNRQYAGLDATGTPDDLIFNLQQGRILRLGVSYNVN
jgi:hemoglobin/transferrin/lactoferrin receptor protein